MDYFIEGSSVGGSSLNRLSTPEANNISVPFENWIYE